MRRYSQSGGAMLTPYEQARRYDNNLPASKGTLNEHNCGKQARPPARAVVQKVFCKKKRFSYFILMS